MRSEYTKKKKLFFIDITLDEIAKVQALEEKKKAKEKAKKGMITKKKKRVGC